MDYFCGLDVSIDTTAVCVVDDKGTVVLQTSVATDPDTLWRTLKPYLPKLKRVGHEAGALSPWLQPELVARGLPAICLETHHVRSALRAQRNKTDATDALGLAHIVRTGWFKTAYIKSEAVYRVRLLLIQRRNLKRKFLDLENTIRHSLKAFGIRLGDTSRGRFDAAVREAVKADEMTSELMDSMLTARAALWNFKSHSKHTPFRVQHSLLRRRLYNGIALREGASWTRKSTFRGPELRTNLQVKLHFLF